MPKGPNRPAETLVVHREENDRAHSSARYPRLIEPRIGDVGAGPAGRPGVRRLGPATGSRGQRPRVARGRDHPRQVRQVRQMRQLGQHRPPSVQIGPPGPPRPARPALCSWAVRDVRWQCWQACARGASDPHLPLARRANGI
jgi:hypothetical protein